VRRKVLFDKVFFVVPMELVLRTIYAKDSKSIDNITGQLYWWLGFLGLSEQKRIRLAVGSTVTT